MSSESSGVSGVSGAAEAGGVVGAGALPPPPQPVATKPRATIIEQRTIIFFIVLIGVSGENIFGVFSTSENTNSLHDKIILPKYKGHESRPQWGTGTPSLLHKHPAFPYWRVVPCGSVRNIVSHKGTKLKTTGNLC
jgi:hypothetical protein